MKDTAQSWLALQCTTIAGACRGVVILAVPEEKGLVPAAYWPDGTQGAPELSAAAELAVAERRGVVRKHEPSASADAEPTDCIAYPLLANGQIFGVVAIEMTSRPEPQQRAVMQLLQWGSAWFQVLSRQEKAATNERLATVLGFIATCLEHARFESAATALATELTMRLSCERVSLGFVQGKHIHLNALSHSAGFGSKTNIVRHIEAAMDEAFDQQATVVFPAAPDGRVQLTRAHAELSRHHGGGSICTVPLTGDGRVIGGLTLERLAGQDFDSETIELCERVASMVGPLLELKRRDDRWLLRKIWDSLQTQGANLVGPRHWGLKFSALTLTGLMIFLSIATGDYRVTAEATLEGSVQRVVTAPQDGYIAQAHSRAGDIVHAGDVLATLDDRDLKLEQLKWGSEREQLLKEYRSALADHDRAQASILSAQVSQAEAQLQLLAEQLARTQLIAPFDGLVVSGDLSQSLGAPVKRGEILFEVAPLATYRVMLNVDERDIAEVASGQQGELALPAISGETMPFTVTRVTPVSVVEDGNNFFRVEARLGQSTEGLRPGMEGIGKIHIERRKLAWIWTHRLIDWLRLWVWSWWS